MLVVMSTAWPLRVAGRKYPSAARTRCGPPHPVRDQGRAGHPAPLSAHLRRRSRAARRRLEFSVAGPHLCTDGLRDGNLRLRAGEYRLGWGRSVRDCCGRNGNRGNLGPLAHVRWGCIHDALERGPRPPCPPLLRSSRIWVHCRCQSSLPLRAAQPPGRCIPP